MSLHYVNACKICGKAYFSPQRRGMYCGPVCKDRAYRGLQLSDKTCPVCGTVFRTFDGRQHYCSAACRTEAKRRRRGVPDKLCVVCGKPLPRRPGGHKTCSPECLKINEARQKNRWAKLDWQRQKAARALQPPKLFERTCPICGAAFQTEARAQMYCGAKCRNKAKHKKRRERAIHVLVCRECGREFKATRTTQKYCSKSCAMRWQHALGIAPKKGGRGHDQLQASWGISSYDADDNMIYGNMIAI